MLKEYIKGIVFRIKPGNVLIIVFLIVLIIPVSSYSQINNTPKSWHKEKVKVLTINDCIQIALNNNHKIKASEEGINIA